MTELTWKSSGINSIAKMKGKKVANWLGGDQYELFAALTKNGMDPAHNKGVTIVQQPFDMKLFLKHQVDAASAMTYNELAQVLETKNPKTGKLFQLSDLNVLKMQNVGTGMLEDNLFSTESYLASKAHQQIAEKVIGATLAGWIYCRDHAAQCVSFTLKAGPTLPRGHQMWMMNQINQLIWPSKTASASWTRPRTRRRRSSSCSSEGSRRRRRPARTGRIWPRQLSRGSRSRAWTSTARATSRSSSS